VLHLGEVDFIDSCGLGQLVRTWPTRDPSVSMAVRRLSQGRRSARDEDQERLPAA
jgi:hypothetical protein